MAKFLDYSGLKHIFEKIIGKKDISEIGDGTCTGAISALNQSLGNKLTNDYLGNTSCKKGIRFDTNQDGSFFTFRPHLVQNILQITKNDNTSLMSINSSGEASFAGEVHSSNITSINDTISNHTLRINNNSNSIDSLNSKIKIYEFASTDGSQFNNDFLSIDLGNRYSSNHMRSAFYLPNASFLNTPTGMPGNCSGIREVYWIDSKNVFVKITEISPNPGKTYCNAYIVNKWVGWSIR